MPATQSEPFKKAVEESRKLQAKPNQDDLLEGKAKRSAWQKKADAGLSAEDAQKQYVETVEKLKEKYGFEG
ncbi:MAG: hypothetical protein M1831_005075 [Alyxoria varia]|nr:MAG: hypothetical protein M1831_005075 [Alyxoria varia]